MKQKSLWVRKMLQLNPQISRYCGKPKAALPGLLDTFNIFWHTKREPREVRFALLCFVFKAYLKHFPILNLIQSKSFPSRPSFLRRKMPCVDGTGQKTEYLAACGAAMATAQNGRTETLEPAGLALE